MRSMPSLVASSAAVLCALVTAQDVRAAALPFHATFTMQIQPSISGPPFIAFDGTGIATSNGPVGGPVQTLALPASAVATAGLVVPVTDPAQQPIYGYKITAHNAAATLSRDGGVLGGTMPMLGAVKVCLFGPCGSPVANIVIPLSGIGSAVTAATQGPLGGIYTVHGAPWTTGTAATYFQQVTVMGSARGPLSGPSSTFAPGGRLKLVVPTYLQGNIEPISILSTLTIDFVPEPTTIALLGAGIGALGARGRQISA